MHRFFVEPGRLQGDRVVFSDAQAHQIRRVLRMEAGWEVVVLDNTALEYRAVLSKVTADGVEAEITARGPAPGEPVVRLTLFQSLLRQEKFEWVLQKGTEAGVARFVPILTRRGLIQSASAVTPQKVQRWRRIVTEAAEQSHRGVIPEIVPVMGLEEAAATTGDYGIVLVAAMTASLSLDEALKGCKGLTTAGLFIGPEGGFEDEEVAMLTSAGARAAHLGPRVLRTETAAVAGSVLILHGTGQMKTPVGSGCVGGTSDG